MSNSDNQNLTGSISSRRSVVGQVNVSEYYEGYTNTVLLDLNWHDVKLNGKIPAFVANVPGNESITDWDALMSVKYDGDDIPVMDYLCGELAIVFGLGPSKYTDTVMQNIQWIYDDYALLRENGTIPENTYFYLKSSSDESGFNHIVRRYDLLHNGNTSVLSIYETRSDGTGNMYQFNYSTKELVLEYVDHHARYLVTAPNKASVGQTIVVKAVDKNGKPTEWEAADIVRRFPADPQFDITLEANTESQYMYLTELDGVPLSDYGFTACYIWVANAVQTEVKSYEFIAYADTFADGLFSTRASAGTGFIHQTSNKWWFALFDYAAGIVNYPNASSLASEGWSGAVGGSPDMYMNFADPVIKRLVFRGVSNYIPAGTHIKIWLR